MRIGFMLRNMNELGGIKVYTQNLLAELLAIGSPHQFYLLYRDPKFAGTYAHHPNVTEVILPFPTKLLWDQLAVPWAARRLGLDVIVNPKLSVPVLSRRPTVFTMHGAEQFAVPQAFGLMDRIYTRIMTPLFCRRARAIITTTRMGVDEILRYIAVDRRKLHPVHEAAHARFRRVERSTCEAIRAKYKLPERFILFVGGINPVKNFSNLMYAFHHISAEVPHTLVAVGFLRWKYRRDVALIQKLGLSDRVIRTGFVPDEDLPAFYNLADLLVLPSLYEGFGIPILEAMACGCPVLTSSTGCTPEVAGEAAIFVDPYDIDAIADGMWQGLSNAGLRKTLVERGFERAADFSWAKAAGESLAIYEQVAVKRGVGAGESLPAPAFQGSSSSPPPSAEIDPRRAV